MTDWLTYEERTVNSRIPAEEKMDGMIYRIESETEFDVLNWDLFSIDVINRCDSDGKTRTIEIYGKSTDEIIKLLNS